jgi:hypothetical protein
MRETHFVQHLFAGFTSSGQPPDFPFPPFGEELMRAFAKPLLEIHLQPPHRNAQVHRHLSDAVAAKLRLRGPVIYFLEWIAHASTSFEENGLSLKVGGTGHRPVSAGCQPGE